MVSSGIAYGHVSPALGERELMAHQFCFSFSLSPIFLGPVFAFGFAPLSLVFGCCGRFVFLVRFPSRALLAFLG